MKLATTTGDFFPYTHSQTEAMTYIREAGFACADYNFGCDHAERIGIYSANYRDYLASVGEHAAKLGLTLVQSHAPMGAPIAKDNAAFISDTARCIEACAVLGIPSVVVHTGYEKGLTVKETFDRNREFFLPLLEVAEKYGVEILAENFNRMCVDGLYWIDNAPDLLAFIEYMDHPLLQAVWDVGHANMQDMPQDEALRLLGSHVRAVHIHDNNANKMHDEHLAPFFGITNYAPVIRGLLEIGYKGCFTLEVGRVFGKNETRRVYEADGRLLRPTLAMRRSLERFLYEIASEMLKAYDCFEG